MSNDVVSYVEPVAYSPAKGMMFHKVNVRINDTTVLFVCESFQTHDGMTTMYGVRQRKEYHSDEKVTTSAHLCVSNTYKYYRECRNIHEMVEIRYIDIDTNQKANHEFSVAGYEQIPCRSLQGNQIISIDSYPVCDENDTSWYTKDEIDCTTESRQRILDHNERILDRNRIEFSTKHAQNVYDECEKEMMVVSLAIVTNRLNYALTRYDLKVTAIDELWEKKYWIVKRFSKKPEYPVKPVQDEPKVIEFASDLCRIAKNIITTHTTGVDLTEFNEVFGCKE